MLLSEQFPKLGTTIVATRLGTTIEGVVADRFGTSCLNVALPVLDGDPSLVPNIDLWAQEGWDWTVKVEPEPVEFPIPMPDMSGLTIFPNP